jgi:hypothetical protein
VSAARNARWTCPKCGDTCLAPRRPRRDDVRRYCLDCSRTTGRLVERTAPALDKQRIERAARAQQARREQAARRRERLAAYYTVDSVDLREAMVEMLRMDVFDTSRGRALRAKPPALVVSRRTVIHTRLGVAQIREHRIRVNVTSDTRAPRALGTLLHEIVHFVVGRRPDGWHGSLFRSTLASAHEEWSATRPRVRAGGVVLDLPDPSEDERGNHDPEHESQPAHA